MASAWVLDGDAALSAEGNSVKCTLDPEKSASQSKHYNAMWKGAPLISGEKYWKVSFSNIQPQTSPWVGVLDEQKFAPGWKIRYLGFGGNLGNGSAGLVLGFGPWCKSGDVVGILASRGLNDDRLKVYLDVNGEPLGLAFDVPADCFSGSIFPAISFGGNGEAKIEEMATVPGEEARIRKKPVYGGGLSGPWRAESLIVKSDGRPHKCEVPEFPMPTMKLTGSGEKYEGRVKILNSCHFRFTRKPAGAWSGQSGPSTLMGGEPFLKFESPIFRMLSNLTVFGLVNDKLHIESEDLKSVWGRYDDTPPAYVGNPFSR